MVNLNICPELSSYLQIRSVRHSLLLSFSTRSFYKVLESVCLTWLFRKGSICKFISDLRKKNVCFNLKSLGYKQRLGYNGNPAYL